MAWFEADLADYYANIREEGEHEIWTGQTLSGILPWAKFRGTHVDARKLVFVAHGSLCDGDPPAEFPHTWPDLRPICGEVMCCAPLHQKKIPPNAFQEVLRAEDLQKRGEPEPLLAPGQVNMVFTRAKG